MLSYNLLITLFLVHLAVVGETVGPLLWPVVVLHAVLTLFLARAWRKDKKHEETILK